MITRLTEKQTPRLAKYRQELMNVFMFPIVPIIGCLVLLDKTDTVSILKTLITSDMFVYYIMIVTVIYLSYTVVIKFSRRKNFSIYFNKPQKNMFHTSIHETILQLFGIYRMATGIFISGPILLFSENIDFNYAVLSIISLICGFAGIFLTCETRRFKQFN